MTFEAAEQEDLQQEIKLAPKYWIVSFVLELIVVKAFSGP